MRSLLFNVTACMGRQNQELEVLLKNIQKGLKIYSVAELNQAIVKVLSYKQDKSLEIQYILKIVCEDYNISKPRLIHNNARGKLQDAKQIAYCLLHIDVGLPFRNIAQSIFFNSFSLITRGVYRLQKADLKIKQDKEFVERYEKLREKLIIFIKEQTIKQHESICKKG